jgi:hypothetical protein
VDGFWLFCKKFPDMKPTREEIEKLLGGELPPDVPIEEVEQWPPPNIEPFGLSDLVCIIKGKYEVFKKVMNGRIVAIYLVLLTLGFPVPTVYQGIQIAKDQFQKVAPIVYRHLNDPPEVPDNWLVVHETESPMPPSGVRIPMDILSIGSGIYPLSATTFSEMRGVSITDI